MCVLCGGVDGPGHTLPDDPNGHPICVNTATQCPACSVFLCNAACDAGHLRAQDVNGHWICASAPGAVCVVCGGLFCNALCVAVHATGADANGHAICPATPSAQCPACHGFFCVALCAGHVAVAVDCGHLACAVTQVTCGGCDETFCGACRLLWTSDICGVCTAAVGTRRVGRLNIRHQFVPGTRGTLRRQIDIEGPITSVSVGARPSPPPPLSSGFTVSTADTGDIKQFDCGHLIALELDGEDDSACIVPQVRQFNRSPGTWRTMETNIGLLIAGTDLTDVAGGVVDASPAAHPTVIDLSLRTANTVNTTWHMEVHLFYHDSMGDPRVPVWFYVRVLRNRRLRAHFSLANRCEIAPAFPDAAEIAEYQAATDLFAAAGASEFKKLSSDDTRLMYTHPPAAGAPPYQVLQYMEDVNDFAASRGQGAVFTTLRNLGRGSQRPYDDEQRPTIRKFNRWVNNGQLRSDVAADWQYPYERADAYQDLSECGSRSAPEVDHVAPSYQGGANLYINGRLVSFYHNHLYREKKEGGSIPVDALLLAEFHGGRLAFTDRSSQARYCAGGAEFVAGMAYVPPIVLKYIRADTVVDGTTSAAALLTASFGDAVLFDPLNNRNLLVSRAQNTVYFHFKTEIDARKSYLKAHDGRELKHAAELALGPAYHLSMGNHRNAVADFIADQNNAGRQRLLALIATATTSGALPQPLPLCSPSNVLLPGGGEATPPPGAPPYLPPAAAAVRHTAAYLAVVARYNAVKVL